jgi:hypothetical protein
MDVDGQMLVAVEKELITELLQFALSRSNTE